MKIATVSNNGKSISAHFGKAKYFVMVTVEAGKIVSQETIDRETIEKPVFQLDLTFDSARKLNVINTASEGHHHNNHSEHGHTGSGKHHNIEPLIGCDLILSRGMRAGMYQRLQSANLPTILTDVININEAVEAYLQGKLVNIPELIR